MIERPRLLLRMLLLLLLLCMQSVHPEALTPDTLSSINYLPQSLAVTTSIQSKSGYAPDTPVFYFRLSNSTASVSSASFLVGQFGAIGAVSPCSSLCVSSVTAVMTEPSCEHLFECWGRVVLRRFSIAGVCLLRPLHLSVCKCVGAGSVLLESSRFSDMRVERQSGGPGCFLCCGIGFVEKVSSSHFANVSVTTWKGEHHTNSYPHSEVRAAQSIVRDSVFDRVPNVFYGGVVAGLGRSSSFCSFNNTYIGSSCDAPQRTEQNLHQRYTDTQRLTSDAEFSHDIFTSSPETGTYGAIYSDEDLFLTVLVHHSVFTHSRDNAIYLRACTTVTVRDSNFSDTSSPSEGGAVNVRMTIGCVLFQRCLFQSTHAANYGGAVRLVQWKSTVAPCLQTSSSLSYKDHQRSSALHIHTDASSPGEGKSNGIPDDILPTFDTLTFHNCSTNLCGAGIFVNSIPTYYFARECLFQMCTSSYGDLDVYSGGGAYFEMSSNQQVASFSPFRFCFFDGNAAPYGPDATLSQWSDTSNPFVSCYTTGDPARSTFLVSKHVHVEWLTRVAFERTVNSDEGMGSDASDACGIGFLGNSPCETLGFAVSTFRAGIGFTIVLENEHVNAKEVSTIAIGTRVICCRGKGRKSEEVSGTTLSSSALSTDSTSLFSVSSGMLTLASLTVEHSSSSAVCREAALVAIHSDELRPDSPGCFVAEDVSIVPALEVGSSGGSAEAGLFRQTLLQLECGSVKLKDVEVRGFLFGGGAGLLPDSVEKVERVELEGCNVTNIEVCSWNRPVLVSGRGFWLNCSGCLFEQCVSSECDCGGVLSHSVGAGVGCHLEKSTFAQSQCKCESVEGSGKGKGGGFYLALENGEALFELEGLLFASNNATVGKNLFFVCPDLRYMVSEMTFGFADDIAEDLRDNALFGQDSGYYGEEPGTDLYIFLNPMFYEVVYVEQEGGFVSRACGSEILPCGTATLGMRHLNLSVEGEKRVVVRSNAVIDGSSDVSGARVEPGNIDSATLEVSGTIEGDGEGVIVNTKTLSFMNISFTLPGSISSSPAKTALILSSGGDVTITNSNFETSEQIIPLCLLRITSGSCVLLSCFLSSFSQKTLRSPHSLIELSPQSSVLSCEKVEISNVVVADGSLIAVLGSAHHTSLSDTNNNPNAEEPAVVTLTKCKFEGITRNEDGATVLRCGGGTVVGEVRISKCTFGDCVSGKSRMGGGMCVGLGGGSELAVSDSTIRTCVASQSEEMEEMGRGGWIYVDGSGIGGMERVPFHFSELSLVMNNASKGRDVFVVCENIEGQIDGSQFQFNYQPGFYNQTNALFGSETVGSEGERKEDFDLLLVISIYQSDTVFVSSVRFSDDGKQCGNVTDACKSIGIGLQHLVTAFENRLVIDEAVELDSDATLGSVTVRSKVGASAKIAVGGVVGKSEAGHESVLECGGNVTFERIEFRFGAEVESEHSWFICSRSALLISRCVFGSVSAVDTVSLLPFALVRVSSGSLSVDDTSIQSVGLSGECIVCEGTGDVMLRWFQANTIALSVSPIITIVDSDAVTVEDGDGEIPSVSLVSSSFSDLSRGSAGATVFGSKSVSVSVHFEKVNCTRCASTIEKGSMAMFEGGSSVTLRDCLFTGELTRPSGDEEVCSWSGSVVHLSECRGTMELVTMKNSSKGGLSVKGGSVVIEEGKCEDNTPQFDQYPSFRRNYLCLGSELGDGELIVSSLKGGDGVKDGSSLWIRARSCSLSGLAGERASAFFIPTLVNVSVVKEGDVYSVKCEGRLLLPCDVWIGVIWEDGSGKETSSEAVEIMRHEDENNAFGVVREELIDGAPPETRVGVVVFFDMSSSGKAKRSEMVVVRERKTSESPSVQSFSERGASNTITALSVVTGVSCFLLVVCVIGFIFFLIRSKREKERMKHPQLFVKDVEMEVSGSGHHEQHSQPPQQRQEPLSYLSDEAKSTDALLMKDERDDDVCVGLRQTEGVQIRKEEPKCKEEDTKATQKATEIISKDEETSSTTSSIDNLVEGMSCESPYEKVIVDTRDSLYERLHCRGGGKGKEEDLREREKRAGHILFWVVNGLRHILESGEHFELLREVTPYCVMFGEEGMVCLGRRPVPVPVGGRWGGRGGKGKSGAGVGGEKKMDVASYEGNRWKAPELLGNDEEIDDEKCAVFSVGMLLYEMVTLQVPFAGIDPISAGVKILHGDRPSVSDLGNGELGRVMESCVCQRASERVRLEELRGMLLQFYPGGGQQTTKSDGRRDGAGGEVEEGVERAVGGEGDGKRVKGEEKEKEKGGEGDAAGGQAGDVKEKAKGCREENCKENGQQKPSDHRAQEEEKTKRNRDRAPSSTGSAHTTQKTSQVRKRKKGQQPKKGDDIVSGTLATLNAKNDDLFDYPLRVPFTTFELQT